MRRIIRGQVALVLGAGLAIATGCSDQLPTLTDSDRIPSGIKPVTIEYFLDAADFLVSGLSVRGNTDISNTNFAIVAENFDGALSAHVVTKFEVPPDSHSSSLLPSGTFQWLEATLRTTVVDSLTSDPAMVFSLWVVDEDFNSSVTWENAINDSVPAVPWSQPGGPTTRLVGTTDWVRKEPEDTTSTRNDLVWYVNTSILQDFAERDVQPGFMITAGDGTQTRLGSISLSYLVQPLPETEADTMMTYSLAQVFRRTIISEPAPPLPANAWSVGGISSDQTLLRFKLPLELPGCATGSCPSIPVSAVSLNRVDLLLEPFPVANGFRPVGPLPITVRLRYSPDLGAQAALGRIVSGLAAPAEGFATGTGKEHDFIITAAVANALSTRDTDFGLALTIEPDASQLSYAWYSRTPRLRFVYTLRQSPELP
ncbi:MAG: hypothetical protein LBG44_00775 [Gemmatimonadota bacterium]|jgi:hypothetical protein|nr:hypothetical protein [Gemmatimonadota bacterium]